MSTVSDALAVLHSNETCNRLLSQISPELADVARHPLTPDIVAQFAQAYGSRPANFSPVDDADATDGTGATDEARAELVVVPASHTIGDAEGLELIDVKSVLSQCSLFDGVSPISERFERGLAEVELGHWLFLIRDVQTDSIMAVAAFDPESAEVEAAVVPESRQRGWGQLLGVIVIGVADRLNPQKQCLQWWSHGDDPAARKVAERWNAELTRELLVMEVATNTDPVSEASSAVQLEKKGFVLLTYTESARRWGADFVDQQWLAVNNRAFDWHPEQGGWTQDTLDRGRNASWYQSDGVLLLWQGEAAAVDPTVPHDDDEEYDPTEAGAKPELVGFHWTKQPHEKRGEVYVIGLDPSVQGAGLGKHLTQAGVDAMRNRGARIVELYVEADNIAAVKAYERLGFTVAQRHCSWSLTWGQ